MAKWSWSAQKARKNPFFRARRERGFDPVSGTAEQFFGLFFLQLISSFFLYFINTPVIE
jgi:hypothetical protein